MSFTDSHGVAFNLPDGTSVAWRISGYAIVAKNDRFLMTQSGNGQWIFPGGGVEESETLADAVVRECLEETGHTVQVCDDQPYFVREQQFYHTREDAFYHSIQLFYTAELVSSNPDMSAISDHDKTRAVDWIDLTSVDVKDIHPSIRELAQKLTK